MKYKNTIREFAGLVLMLRRIYKVRRRDGFRWHDTFQDDWYRRSSNIKLLPQESEAAMLILLMAHFYQVCSSDGFRCHDTNIPNFIKIGSGFQKLLREWVRRQ
jgi:hypothetical protein